MARRPDYTSHIEIGYNDVITTGMIKQLTKVGNSQALVLDKTMLELLGLNEGDSVRLSVEGRKLIVESDKRDSRLEQVGALLKEISDRHDTAFSNLAQ